MFRSLATRLIATYVFAAIVLVVIVIAAVTALYLSMFGISARETSEQVAREVPEEVRLELARYRTLDVAAANIARHLARPGLRVAVFERSGPHRRLLATALVGRDGGQGTTVFVAGPPPGGPAALPPKGGPPGLPFARARRWPPDGPFRGFGDDDRPPRRFEHMDPFPFALNSYLRLEPRSVDFPGGRVVFFPDPGDLVRAVNAFWVAMLPIGAFVVVAAWLLGRYITGQALRPLVETTASLRRFGAGDFTPRPIETTARDEIGELAQAYNAAAAQVSAAFERRAAADLEMRQFIADAGHELRTPLTVIMGFVDVLRRRSHGESGGANKIFDTMLAESRRMKALIDKLILLARLEAQPRELETVDLAGIARSVAHAFEGVRPGARIDVTTAGNALVRGYESELHDAVSNLIENALKYAPGSPVDVRVFRDRDDVCVDIADSGPGIPPDEQSQVFSRFFRGRDRGDAEGFGLGLAIARRAVERAGGTLTLESAPGHGSRFTIRVPQATRGEAPVLAV